ncbi:hypothetical protein JAAARDRAFT_137340 [Jaapia argillacea MUCL 33604]|uniref:Kinesin-like protein n=1 Tax=Jaapia argillacea MUCL 33604 TaxID=933084 RepID=A0A067PPR9_9AGAM|nr:hypothetical protein JAAARDRAFT_137340 [Jaapia argillacea MUCL 33604]
MAHKVKIAARLRPRLAGELEDDSIHIIKETGGSAICVTNPRDSSQVFKFPFTSCYDQSSTQEEIFDKDVKPLIDVVFSGVTVTIFAYGVTSSGKTHTMQGTKSDQGVIPRVVRSLFSKRAHLPPNQTIAFTVSYIEIYKDEVYDLLVNRDNAPKLPVRENDAGQVFVANLTKTEIGSVQEFDGLYSRATKHRSVGATNLNRASSRSHAVLTIEVAIGDLASDMTLTGKINLVDLAGSENNKLTGNDASRMAESAAINKSLSVLGQVVHALNQGASRIPYRDSKLTRLLQDALGGSAVGLLICNLAPGMKFRQDTLNTLNFAVRTKNVENKPVVNERDNRPAPKLHFAALAPSAPKLAPAGVALGGGGGGGASRPSLVPRQSIAPRIGGGVGPSRMPRGSMVGAGGSGYQNFAVAGAGMGKGIGGISEEDIDARIAKMVENEVTRRLEEKERERADKAKAEEERRVKEQELQQREEVRSSTPPAVQSEGSSQTLLPSGVLTPLLKRHEDLDVELRSRLQELEKKFERDNKEIRLADVLSPVSRKKTGRAYVALARAHSDKGDLHVALELYRKASTYVTDNVKLQERIIEIEWAVKNGKDFRPSPKRSKKNKSKKRERSKGLEGESSSTSTLHSSSHNMTGGTSLETHFEEPEGAMEIDEESEVMDMVVVQGDHQGQGRSQVRFGSELTNRGDGGDESRVGTPAKKTRSGKGKRKSAEVVSDDEWEPPAPVKRGKRKLAVS